MSTNTPKGVPFCRSMKQPHSRIGNVIKRGEDKVPMRLDDLGSQIERACIVETLLWDPSANADLLSEQYYGRALATRGWTQREVMSYWSIAMPLPQQDLGVFGRQEFQGMCYLLAARHSNGMATPSEFRSYPHGWNMHAGFKNDKGPWPSRMIDTTHGNNIVITHASCKFMANVKHGIIAIEATKQAKTVVEEERPDALMANSPLTLPQPRSTSDLLASWWRSQHGKKAGAKYFSEEPLKVGASTLEKWTTRLEYIVLPENDAVVDIVLTSLGYQEGYGIIPGWPGVTFQAGTHWYLMLLATESGSAVAEFLYQHREFLGHKVLKSVTVLSLDGPQQEQKPTLIWRVIDYSPQANAEREHLQAAPYEEVHFPTGPAQNDP